MTQNFRDAIRRAMLRVAKKTALAAIEEYVVGNELEISASDGLVTPEEAVERAIYSVFRGLLPKVKRR